MHSKGLAFACINRSFRALDCQMYASHGQDTQKIPRLVNMNSDPSLEVPEDSHIGMHSAACRHVCSQGCLVYYLPLGETSPAQMLKPLAFRHDTYHALCFFEDDGHYQYLQVYNAINSVLLQTWQCLRSIGADQQQCDVRLLGDFLSFHCFSLETVESGTTRWV